jgi:hypothetical protein
MWAADLHICKSWVRCVREVVEILLDCLLMGMSDTSYDIATPSGGWLL